MFEAVSKARQSLAPLSDGWALINLLGNLEKSLEVANEIRGAEQNLRLAIADAVPAMKKIEDGEAANAKAAEELSKASDQLRADKLSFETIQAEWRELRDKEYGDIKSRKAMIATVEANVQKTAADLKQKDEGLKLREAKIAERESEIEALRARYDGIERALQGRHSDPNPA